MTPNIISWIISIFFILFGFFGLFVVPLPFFFILFFGIIVNPKILNKLKTKYNLFNKKWIKPTIFLLCMILFSATAIEIPNNETEISNEGNQISQINNKNDNQSDNQSDNQPVTQTNTEELTPINNVPPVEENAKLTVHYLDVGQADSIFIELPNKETILIDAGNNGDGEIIVNYIKNLNYDTINYLVGTHPHEDHIGGLDTVINTFNIDKIYMPKAQTNTITFKDVLKAIQDKGLKVNTAKVGVNILNIDNLNIDIIAPKDEIYDNLNNYSAVIKLTYGNNSFLFMGDAETLSENEITTDVKVDVLKVGHHGSNTSTSQTFLNKVKPTYAVISIGKDNSYGHPANEVLALLNEFNVNVFRTDEQGTIIISSDGNTISTNNRPSPYESNAPPTIQQIETPVVEQPVIVEEIPAIEQSKEIIVYITKTGEKYHRDGCQYLRKSKIETTLKNAASNGYTPCSKCNPPQ